MRYAATDVHYLPGGGGRAAVAVYDDERFAEIRAAAVVRIARVAPYQPGEFALRELPAIRDVLQSMWPLDLLVVDGYVTSASVRTRV